MILLHLSMHGTRCSFGLRFLVSKNRHELVKQLTLELGEITVCVDIEQDRDHGSLKGCTTAEVGEG